MKHRLFIPVFQEGKYVFQFTKEELEKLLDEVYTDGYEQGLKKYVYCYPTNDPSSTGNSPLNPYITWTGPTDVPCTSDSRRTYTTVTTARKESNL